MPKPLLLQRPSGLFVRFLLPLDIRRLYGSRFIVRSLGGLRGDDARWRAACLGYALTQALTALRQGGGDVDTKKLIDAALAAAARGDIKKYEVSLPGGFSVRADSEEDHGRAMEALAALGRVAVPGLGVLALPPTAQVPTVPQGPTLHESIDRFLAQFEQKGRADATVAETIRTLTLFRDLVDDVPMKDVGTEQTDRFLDCMKHWPARARVLPEYRDLSARAIVEKARKNSGAERIGPRTLDKHLDRLRVFFNSAKRRKELVDNPLAGERVQTSAQKYEESRRGFTRAELLKVFDPGLREKHAHHDPHYFWVPVLMLFLGARMNEIVYLDVTDIENILGHPGVHLTKAKGGKMKNASATRFVPLPLAVLRMGFREYAEDVRAAGFINLFPGGSEEAKNGRGDKVSKWFNRTYLRKACGILDEEVCLQAFRNTMMSRADRVGISEAQLNPLVGHGPKTIKQKHYIDPPTLDERAKHIACLADSFELPPLTPYRRGQFTAYFEDLKRAGQRAGVVAKRAARRAKAGKGAQSK